MTTNAAPDKAKPSAVVAPREAKISSFGRRLGAFVIDVLILAILGYALGAALPEQFAALGGLGPAVGFLLALPYFGILGSSWCGGQTLGKRIFRIRVVDLQGKPVSPARSFARAAVLTMPYFLNSLAFPLNPVTAILGSLLAIVVLGLGGSILYLLLFNRRTGQSTHDLAAETCVATVGDGSPAVPSVWPGHFVVVGIWLVLCLGFVVVELSWSSKEVSPTIQAIEAAGFPGQISFKTKTVTEPSENLQQDETLTEENFISVYPTSGDDDDDDPDVDRFLKAQVTLKQEPQSPEDAATQIASIILDTHPAAKEQDAIAIILRYGFDIGIASRWQSYRSVLNSHVWREPQYRKKCEEKDAEACSDLGKLFLAQKDAASAMPFLHKSCELGNMGSCASLGFILMAGGKKEEAQALFTKSCDAGEVYGCGNLSRLLVENGDTAGAEKLLRDWCKKGASEGCSNLAALLLQRGENDEAQTLLRKVCDGGELSGCGNLGWLLMLQGKDAEAEPMLAKACEKSESTSACRNLNIIKMLRGEIPRNEEDLQAACTAGVKAACNPAQE